MNRQSNLSTLFSFRNLFWFSLVCTFVLLPLLSLDAGISGDEPVHYQHAEYVSNYFNSNKADTAAIHTPYTNLKYYGQVVDNLSYRLNSWLDSSEPYKTRHFLNAILAALLILFTSLTAKSVSGYRAALLVVLFLLLSPRFLGHSYNNLKDIPFALGFALFTWGMVGVMKQWPRLGLLHWFGIALGFGLAFGIRSGGVLLVPIAFLFLFLYWLHRYKNQSGFVKQALPEGGKLIGLILIALLLGFFFGIIDWPFARLNPWVNPIKSLQMMTHYEVSIRTVFNGDWIWSENLPWYYALKWIMISTPLVVSLGFVLHFIRIRKMPWPVYSLLLFITIFPIFWTIFQQSNLYGGWRHLLFVYPTICILSAYAWIELFNLYKRRLLRFSILVLLGIGLVGPALHVIKNHPVEYVYFNHLAGSVDKNQGKFETDYYFHAVRPAMKWLNRELAGDIQFGKSPRIASNFPLEPFAEVMDFTFEPVLVNYYNRGKEDWDYAVFSSTYLGPQQLGGGYWPPLNTIHQIQVNHTPVCVVLERRLKDDIQALSAYRQSRFTQADSLYAKVLTVLPQHETALLYRAWTQKHMQNYLRSDSLLNTLLTIHPLSDNARDLMAKNAMSRGDFIKAQEIFIDILANNHKYLPAYEQLGVVSDHLSQPAETAHYLELGYQLGLRDSASIQRLVKALETMKDTEKAHKFRSILNKN